MCSVGATRARPFGAPYHRSSFVHVPVVVCETRIVRDPRPSTQETGTLKHVCALVASIFVLALAVVSGQSNGRQALERGRGLWDQRLSKSAIAALETASRDRDTAAEALETLG